MARSVLVISGFHRSATSLCGQWLHDAGLHMGYDLMPGAISNPYGHFEDLPAVKMHDTWLSDAQTSWQFHDEVSLEQNESRAGEISKYIAMRDSVGKCWGVKDPRACLFLNEWAEGLGERGRYLVLLRHWGACIESLLKRHSEHIAFPANANALSANIQFWANPTLAARMWLSYCKRILLFLKRQSDQSMVVTQKALFRGINLPGLVSNELGIALNECSESPIEPSLITDTASIRIKECLPKTLIQELDAVWQQLLTYTHGFNPVDETAEWRTDTEFAIDMGDPRTLKTVTQKQSGNAVVSDSIGLSDVLTKVAQVQNAQEICEVFDSLNNLRTEPGKSDTISFIVNWVSRSQFANHRGVLLSVARWVNKQGEAELAYQCWLNCLNFDEIPAYVYHSLAQYELVSGKFKAALKFNGCAIKRNANNPHFWLHKAKLHFILSNFDEALDACNQAYELSQQQPNLVSLIASILDTLGKTPDAIAMLEKAIENMNEKQPFAIQNLIRLKLKQKAPDAKECVARYNQELVNAIESKDGYLMQALGQAGSQIAEVDLNNRIRKHWENFEV